ICAGVQSGQLSAAGRVAPSGAALDADDVAGETDQDRREGGAPFAAGDLSDGRGGNPTGIVPDYSGKDWVAEIAHTATRLMLAGRQSRKEVLAGMLCLRSVENQCRTQSRAEGIVSAARKGLLAISGGIKCALMKLNGSGRLWAAGHMGNVGLNTW